MLLGSSLSLWLRSLPLNGTLAPVRREKVLRRAAAARAGHCAPRGVVPVGVEESFSPHCLITATCGALTCPTGAARLRQRSLETGDFQLKGPTKNIIVSIATARAIQWGGSLQDIAKRSEMRNSHFNWQSCNRAKDPQKPLLFI